MSGPLTPEALGRPQSAQTRPRDAAVAYKGSLFTAYSWQQQLFDGSSSTFEQLARPDTVLVLPVSRRGRVYLVRERQPGTREMFRSIGGRVEAGEAPSTAAARELVEETGLAARSLELWTAWQPVNKVDWAVYIYVAGGLTQLVKAPDAGEEVKIVDVGMSEFLNYRVAAKLDDRELGYALGQAAMNRTDAHRLRRLILQARRARR